MSDYLDVWDLRILTINHQILKEKLNLYFHISCLPKDSLSYRILQVQKHLLLPSIYEEVSPFLNRHEISDVTMYTKREWKAFVSRAIHLENREFLIQSSKKYKKTDHLSLACEDYKIKDYFSKLNLAQARLKFRIRSGCVKFCKVQYPSDKTNLKTLFVCPEKECHSIDNIWHWRTCISYAPQRKSRNLNDESQLLAYFQDILKLRQNEQNS